MTKREYYDLLLRSCDDGTFPSGDLDGCYYRGVGNKRCAVGVLIPDDVWASWTIASTNLNGLTVFDLDARLKRYNVSFDFNAVVEGLNINDLRDVQKAHDLASHESAHSGVAAFKETFVSRLRRLPFFREYAA